MNPKQQKIAIASAVVLVMALALVFLTPLNGLIFNPDNAFGAADLSKNNSGENIAPAASGTSASADDDGGAAGQETTADSADDDADGADDATQHDAQNGEQSSAANSGGSGGGNAAEKSGGSNSDNANSGGSNSGGGSTSGNAAGDSSSNGNSSSSPQASAPPPASAPEPAPAPEPATITVYVSIECTAVVGHPDLNPKKQGVVPGGGWILGSQAVTLEPGQTVLDAIRAATRNNGIQLDVSGGGGSAYVRGIANLYERDCGSRSGWKFSVNGSYPSAGCGSVKVSDGDSIVWSFKLKP